MSYLEKFSDQVDTFVGVCHHLAAKHYVTGHGGNLAWKLDDDVILITPTKHNKGDVSRENVKSSSTVRGRPLKEKLNRPVRLRCM